MEPSRRPIKARKAAWATPIAKYLTRLGITPNQISIASAVFAAGSGFALWLTNRPGNGAITPWLFLLAALGIQLRLLCNLFDGMVAIEGGRKTKSGEIFNELPDRFADGFILVGAGYGNTGAEWTTWLGWLCAVLAIMTAYVRALGVAAGGGQQFCGPMAKQHRMAIMTIAIVAAAIVSWSGISLAPIAYALVLIAAGSLITVFRRTARVIDELESR